MKYDGPKISQEDFKKDFCKNFLPGDGFLKVTFMSTIDGDTAYFKVAGFQESVRFNVIDAPQYYPIETPYAKESFEYVDNKLKNAKEIYLESDKNNTFRDDTLNQRLLAWVWVDNELLNYNIIRNGLATVKYIISPKMKYLNDLAEAEKKAQQEHLGIYEKQVI